MVEKLSKIPPPKISGFDRAVGLYTVGFKKAGFFGWKDLGFKATAKGQVILSEKSTDRFLTVDIVLDSIWIDSETFQVKESRYLRAEICMRNVNLLKVPKVGEKITMSGKLFWDGDGFIEIHAQKTVDIISTIY